MLDDKKRKEPTSLEINEGNDFKEVDEINKNPANQDDFEENLEPDYEHKTSEKDHYRRKYRYRSFTCKNTVVYSR